ncbi:MAG TPA: hypothetical protein VMU56_00820 [Beijerinckiaceae bacterium]|nr:hypothetical protein [Beijerinckiaceae bacterium]HVB89943.1 hypothetical protein [Beijerinckiaceae bacterium]
MTDLSSDTVVEPFAALTATVEEASFAGARQFRLSADLLILSAMRNVVRTRAAQDAAAEAARDCGALAADLAEAGSSPNSAWQEAIRQDRQRALSAVSRLEQEWASCPAILVFNGRERQRYGSVPMRKKSSHSPSQA